MTKQTEALKLALEALEELWGLGFRTIASKQQKAITAIKEALAEQPAQQVPVAAETTIDISADHEGTVYATEFLPSGTKLYTTPPASKPWVGLTKQEIDKIYRDLPHPVPHWQLSRAIEATLREKNAAPCKPLTDEPVIRWKCKGCGHEYMEAGIDCDCVTNKGYERIEYFTAPQPSKPLTERHISKLWSDAHNDTTDRMAFQVLARLVEAAHNIGGEA